MQALNDWLSQHRQRLAVDAPGEQISYEDLADRVRAMALELLERGVAPGDRVAVQLENGLPLIVALHAIWMFRAVAAPLSPRLTAEEVARAIRVLGPKAFVTEKGIEGPESQGGALTDPSDSAVELSAGADPAHTSRDFAIVWTSGTSGEPRGVVLTRDNIGHSAQGSRERMSLGPQDRWYLGLSCAHVGGLALVTRAALLGSGVVVRGSFSASTFNALVDDGRVTHASLVPTMLVQALEERGERPPPTSLRGVLIGGAHAPRDLVDRALAAGFPVWLTYGMTEATSQVATAPPELVRRKPGTVGQPLSEVEVRIAGQGRLRGEAGEILVRGATVARRYLAENAGPGAASEGEGTSSQSLPITDPEGWLHTGDLGFLDEDGHLFVTGRLSDRIISAGVNVDPAEVEEVLRRHADVADAAVVGLEDPKWGEVVAALVVRTAGSSTEGSADSAALRTALDGHARAHLSSTKVPRRYAFSEAVPRNANGKVDRVRVRELIERG